MDLNSKFSFVETHVLVRLIDVEATAIIPVARISAVITDKKIGRRKSVRVLL